MFLRHVSEKSYMWQSCSFISFASVNKSSHSQNLYPAAVIGGLGALGFAYFVNRIDDGYNKSLHAFEALHHNVDHRLEHLEDAIYNRGKEQKKLDFKTKMLCKFANLFNNPTYEICNNGFEPGQVVGPTGAGSGYGGRVSEGKKTMKS